MTNHLIIIYYKLSYPSDLFSVIIKSKYSKCTNYNIFTNLVIHFMTASTEIS